MKLSQFKNILRETLKEVLREELNDIRSIIMEGKTHSNTQYKSTSTKDMYYNEPSTIEPIINNSTGNPLLDILNETKNTMTGDDWSNMGTLGSENAQNFNPNHFMPQSEPLLGSVGDMLHSSNKSNDINQINIDVVPNYKDMMTSMINKGTI